MPIKTTCRYYYKPIRMSKSRTLMTVSVGGNVGQEELSFTAGWNENTVQSLWKTVWQRLIKANILLPYDPAITLPRI